MEYTPIEIAELFARAHVLGSTGNLCWEWTASKAGGREKQRYGVWRHKYAHRVAYEMCVGPIPEGHVVMHRCDNPLCVKPDHLMVGTVQDNTQDMKQKGRGRKPDPVGVGKGRYARRVSLEERQAIADDPRIQRVIAEEYGITQSSVSRIKREMAAGKYSA